MTVSRREWRGTFVPSQSSIYIEDHMAFGWKIRQHIMPPGAKLITVSSRVIERAKASNITLTVRGRGVVTGADGTSYPDRIPGLFSPERGDVPEGAVSILADTELEFWCFNWTANRRALPQTEVLRITQNQEITLPEGQRVFICLGELGSHCASESFVADGSAMQALAPTYGFLIGGTRD